MKIQVMGPGCANCARVAELVQEALDRAGIDGSVEKVTDFAEMAKAGVLSTPALVIDGEVKCTGRIPRAEEIAAWLT